MAVKGKVVSEINQEELLQLVDRTWYKDARGRYVLEFSSEQQRAQYLRQSRRSRDTVHEDLKNLDELGKSAEDVYLFRTINKIYNYTLYAYDFAYQYVAEPVLRAEYIGHISSHSKHMEQETVAASGDLDKLRRIAHDAAWYRNLMIHYLETEQKSQVRSFIGWMKRNKLKVEDIVKRYVSKLKFRGPFNKLTVVQKLQVWNAIIKDSGKSTFEITEDLNSFGQLGLMVLLITSSIIVFDIFISDHKPARVLKDGTSITSSRVDGVDGFAVDAMNIIWWWGKLPDRYKTLPAEVVYGKQVARGITAGQAVAFCSGITFVTTGAILVKAASIYMTGGGITATNIYGEADGAMLLQDLSGSAEDLGAVGAAEAETSLIEGAEVTSLLEGEVAGDLLAEDVMLGAMEFAPLAAGAIELAPVIAVIAVVVVVGFILFKILSH